MRSFLNTTQLSLIALAVLASLATTAQAGCTPGVNSDGSGNTCLGSMALQQNTNGNMNTAAGYSALKSNTEGYANTALGWGSLQSNGHGVNNTAVGALALHFNETGQLNTALGWRALLNNVEGTGNTALGAEALSKSAAIYNTAVGYRAMLSNTIGISNAALGAFALLSNTTGIRNVALGAEAMAANTTGENNTAVGNGALASNVTGNQNTALGVLAGNSQTGSGNLSLGFRAAFRPGSAVQTGNNNIAIGSNAGADWTTGSNNIAMGSPGVAGDVNTIRIGTPGTQARTFIAGIRGATVARRGASTVLIDATGQLGTVRSSIRYKEDVHPMGNASSPLLELRPVTFRYKEVDADGTKPIQYGLIAEEVEKVLPELVVRNEDGSVETVAYHLLPSLLLNEYQKQNRELVETKAALAGTKQDLAAMASEVAQLRLIVSRLAAASAPVSLAAADR